MTYMKKLTALIIFVLLLCSLPGSLSCAQPADAWDDFPPLDVPFTVEGYVWHDLNQNGLRDEGEPCVPGITVRLFTWDNKGGTGISGSSGYYSIKDIYADSYIVSFVDPNKNYTKASTHVGGVNTDLDSDCGAEIALNEDNSRVDIGLIKLFVLSGEVYEDLNKNGQRDEEEPPFAAEVKLDWGANTSINDDTKIDKSNFRFKVAELRATLSITPLDAAYKMLSGEESYVSDIDFADGDIVGLSIGFVKKSLEPIETPEPTESPVPTEGPLPTSAPEPAESPNPAETSKPAESSKPPESSGTTESSKAYEPPTEKKLPTYASAQEKNKDESEVTKRYTSKGKIFIVGSEVYYSSENLKEKLFNSDIAKKARLGTAQDRILLDALLWNIESDFEGWIFVNGALYYCARGRTILHSGFKLINGDYYYFAPSGEAIFMLTR